MIRPGEIYWADLSGGAGRRPVIVVSREALNRGNFVLAVPFTTQQLARRRTLSHNVFFGIGEFGLLEDSVAQCEALLTVGRDELDLIYGPLGTLDDLALRSVIKAIGAVLDADCEPE